MSVLETRPESYPEAGLTVMRRVLDIEVVQGFEKDCRHYMTKLSPADHRPEHMSQGRDSGKSVLTRRFEAAELRSMERPATLAVLAALDIDDDYFVSINRQPRYSSQAFHRDYHLLKPVKTIHASPDGALQYAPEANTGEEAEDNHETLLAEQGDVVEQITPWVLHRGSNPSDRVRYTAVAYRPKPDFE